MRRDSDVGSKDVDKDTTRTGSTHTDSDLEKNEVFEHEMSGALDGTDAGHESIPIRVLDHETNANESVVCSHRFLLPAERISVVHLLLTC